MWINIHRRMLSYLVIVSPVSICRVVIAVAIILSLEYPIIHVARYTPAVTHKMQWPIKISITEQAKCDNKDQTNPFPNTRGKGIMTKKGITSYT